MFDQARSQRPLEWGELQIAVEKIGCVFEVDPALDLRQLADDDRGRGRYALGTQLRLTGTTSADLISVTRDAAGGLLVNNSDGWSGNVFR